MKRILSLVLAISLCFSAVILLNSCKGKSAYEVAVDGGFTGTEQEWLASLKGEAGAAGDAGATGDRGKDGLDGLDGITGMTAYEKAQMNGYKLSFEKWFASLFGSDGKNGHNVTVTVDKDGYWVIDGAKQPVKVDGSSASVVSLELVQKVFSVVRGNATAPTLEIKVKLDDGSEATLPVSDSIIASSSYDFTKEGKYDVSINYGDVTTTDTITVEGLMVVYEDFNNFSDTDNMAQILDTLGWKLPVGILGQETGAGNNTRETLAENLSGVLGAIPGVNLENYAVIGTLTTKPNYVTLSVNEGRLLIDNDTDNLAVGFVGDHSKNHFDGAVLVRDGKYMEDCYNGNFTLQVDIEFAEKLGSKCNGNIAFAIFAGNDGNGGKHSRFWYQISPSGSLLQRIQNNGSYTETFYKNLAKDYPLFANQTEPAADLYSQKITYKMVVVTDVMSPDFGVNVYVKAYGEAEFILVSSMQWTEDTAYATLSTAFEKLISDENTLGGTNNNFTIGLGAGGKFYIDNLAIWTGTEDMPTNTSTIGYEMSITPTA